MSYIRDEVSKVNNTEPESEVSMLLTKLADQISSLKIDVRELNHRLSWISREELDRAIPEDAMATQPSLLANELSIRVEDVCEIRREVQDILERLTI